MKVSLRNPFARCVGSFLTIVGLAQPNANLTPTAFVGSAGHVKLVTDKGPRVCIPDAAPIVPSNTNKAAITLPLNPTKPATKNWANKKRGNILTFSTSTTTDTTSNFMSVTLNKGADKH